MGFRKLNHSDFVVISSRSGYFPASFCLENIIVCGERFLLFPPAKLGDKIFFAVLRWNQTRLSQPLGVVQVVAS